MRKISLALVGFLFFASSQAFAFGTVEGVKGQNREHERVTRHALGCAEGLDRSICFEPESLDEIAGKGKSWKGIYWGAVGAPDNPATLLMFSSSAHCDNGDYVDSPGYPHTKAAARQALLNCRAEMNKHMNEAVRDAEKLLLANGKVKDAEIPTYISCTYLYRNRGPTSRAKCNVLEDFGRVLHASQDFYSHSNWADHAGPGALSLENPTGLDNRGRSPWLDLRQDNPPFPEGLITGCYDTLSNLSADVGCPHHVKHYYLNKDTGQIDPTLGAGKTPRGSVDDNFRHAVEAAIDDTRDKWAILRERLVAAYGPAKGHMMICAITHDDPAKTCG
jgi:hypothetical protein